MEKRYCPDCGVTSHLPLTERKVDKQNYCVILIRRWICQKCLEESVDEREWIQEEQT